MAGSGKKWLTGCGIGCGLMVLIAGGVGTCGYLGVKRISDRAESVEGGFEALRADYGRPGAFVPAADGRIPADRLELFLTVRDDMRASREGLAGVLTNLEADVEGPAGVIAKIRSGLSLIPSLFDFIDDRNAALLDRGMGLGEYLHIYSVAYYAWLGRDPADGPDFRITGDGDHEDGGVQWSVDADEHESVRDARDQEIRRYLHGVHRKLVGNQLTVAETEGADPDWITVLREEAGALDARPLRLLWADGVPPRLADSLEPFRTRLEDSYSPVMNAVEMGLVQNE
jgi:hypothetical protein